MPLKGGVNLNNDTIMSLFNIYVDSQNIKNIKLRLMKTKDSDVNQSTNNNIEWNRVSYLIEIPVIIHGKLYINISSNSNVKAEKIYLTDLYLTKLLLNSPNFKITKDLKMLIDINSVKPNSYILKDQSNSGNDLVTISGDKLNYNIVDNKFSLYNNIYESAEPASNILGIALDELTISIYISITQPGLYNNLITIPGNQANTVSISVDNILGNGIIIVILNDDIKTTLSTKNKSLVLGNTLITITYSNKNKELIIWQEDTKIASLNTDVNLLPSSRNKIKINLKNNKVGHPNLIGLAMYSSVISKSNDLTTISTYFQNQRKLDRPSVAQHIFTDSLDNSNSDNTLGEYNNDNSLKKNSNDTTFFIHR